MATQDVHFSITQPDITTGTVGWTGTLLAVPVGTSGHPVVHVDGVDLVVPEPISITITSGEATVAMEITGTTWVWMVKSVDSDSNPMLPARFVSVAASASTVEFADLPQIDLATLSPTANPTAAWDAALAALQAEVDALGTGLPTGGTTGQALVKNSSTDGDVAWGNVSVSAASTTAQGIVELATNTETTTGTDTARATTPAGVKAALDARASGYDASGAATAAQTYAVQRANHTGTQTASTISDFATAALAAAPAETTTTLGSTTNGATAKTTPVDADLVPLVDSAASNVVKKLTWANLKATLKTYFDTLYLTAAGLLTALAAQLTALATGLVPVTAMTFAAASALGSRPDVPGIIVVVGGSVITDTKPSWMAANDIWIASTAS